MNARSTLLALLSLATLASCRDKGGGSPDPAEDSGDSAAPGTPDSGDPADSGDSGDSGDTAPDPEADADGDGVTVEGGDCDDADPKITTGGASFFVPLLEGYWTERVDAATESPGLADVDADGALDLLLLTEVAVRVYRGDGTG